MLLPLLLHPYQSGSVALVLQRRGWKEKKKKWRNEATYWIPLCAHAVPKRLGPLSAQNAEDHHERVEKILEIPARHGIRVEVLGRVVSAEELHPDDGKDVDDDGQHKRQISQCAQRRQDDGQEDTHRRPRLRQSQHSHLQINRQIIQNR